jgi:hypothetical protein
MDLNHIDLTPSLVSALFPGSLIETQEHSAPSHKKNTWNYTGNNQKNILLLLNYPGETELSKKQHAFLEKMMNACSISYDDLALMNLNQNPGANYKNLHEYFKSKIVLLFNIEPSSFGLPISFPQFQVQSFATSTFLFIPAIEELEKDNILESKLWVCLRRIFGI